MLSLKDIVTLKISQNIEIIIVKYLYQRIPRSLADLLFKILNDKHNGFPGEYLKYFHNQSLASIELTALKIDNTSNFSYIDNREIRILKVYKATRINLKIFIKHLFGRKLKKLKISQTMFPMNKIGNLYIFFGIIFKNVSMENLINLNLSFTNLNDHGFKFFCTKV